MKHAKVHAVQMSVCPLCDHAIYPHAKQCPGCKTYFAAGSLQGIRTPKHASPVRVPRDWVDRFIGV